MKTKKDIYQFITYSIYRYAPESFKLYFNNQLIKLSPSKTYELGSIYVSKGKSELLKAIKQFIRKETTLNNKLNNPILAIRSYDNAGYCHIGLTVKRYDIKDKLRIFKWIKESINEQKNTVRTHTAKLDASFKPTDVKETTEVIKLGKRVCFIY